MRRLRLERLVRGLRMDRLTRRLRTRLEWFLRLPRRRRRTPRRRRRRRRCGRQHRVQGVACESPIQPASFHSSSALVPDVGRSAPTPALVAALGLRLLRRPRVKTALPSRHSCQSTGRRMGCRLRRRRAASRRRRRDTSRSRRRSTTRGSTRLRGRSRRRSFAWRSARPCHGHP